MGNYNLGLSNAKNDSNSSPPSYTLNINYKSIFSGKDLPQPKAIDLPPNVVMSLYKQVEAKFQANMSGGQKAEQAIHAALKLDWNGIPESIRTTIYESLVAASNEPAAGIQSKKKSSDYLNATGVSLGFIELLEGYSLLVGLDHRDQPRAYGLSVKEINAGDSLTIKLDLIYDERGPFGNSGNGN